MNLPARIADVGMADGSFWDLEDKSGRGMRGHRCFCEVVISRQVSLLFTNCFSINP